MTLYHSISAVDRSSLMFGLAVLSTFGRRPASADADELLPGFDHAELTGWLLSLRFLADAVDGGDPQLEFEAVQAYLHGRTKVNGLRAAFERPPRRRPERAGVASELGEAIRFMLDFDDHFFSNELYAGATMEFVQRLGTWFESSRHHFLKHLRCLEQGRRAGQQPG